MFFGIALGVMAAFNHSLAYIASRFFMRRYPTGTVHLLVTGHIIMGFLAIIAAVLLWPESLPPLRSYYIPLFFSVAAYLVGQGSLFMALRTSEASRVSPLLGLKVFFLAVISIIFLQNSYSVLQWTAIIMTVSAALILSTTGGTMKYSAIIWICVACLTYCISDISITILVRKFEDISLLHAAAFSAALGYILIFLAAVAIFPFLPRPTPGMALSAVPFAVFWFIAMLCLYGCFGSIGFVFGNIVQSTRGIISIGLGVLIAAMGHEAIEQKISGRIMLRRLLAAAMMVAAVALFYNGAN